MSAAPVPARWRPMVVGLVVAVHAVAFVGLGGRAAIAPGSGEVEIEVTTELDAGAAAPDVLPVEDAAPPPPEEPQRAETPPPEPTPPPAAEELSPPPPAEVAEPAPPPSPPELRPDPTPAPTPRPDPAPKPKREAKRRAPVETTATTAARAGDGEIDAHAQARAYAALISAELARVRHYPPAARAAGITGTVTVAFSIGPAGTVTAHRIVRASGDAALDAAAERMMSALSLPPPPDGGFRSVVPIRFDLAR